MDTLMINQTNKLLITLGSLIVVLLGLAIAALLAAEEQSDVALEIGKALLSAAIAILVSGALSVVITQTTRRETKRDEQARLLAASLQSVKASYERVSIARYFLVARPTAWMLTEQLPELLSARAHLQRVQRETLILGTRFEDYIQEMLDYIGDVTLEYGSNYTALAIDSLREREAREAVATGSLQHFPAYTALGDEQRFPATARLISEDGWKNGAFHQNYKKVRDGLTDSVLRSSR